MTKHSRRWGSYKNIPSPLTLTAPLFDYALLSLGVDVVA